MGAGFCEGRVVVITGAGRGIGREHALLLAREGAHVVVNDLGSERDGSGSSSGPAANVVAEIEAFGGVAVPNTSDVSTHDGAREVIEQAIDAFGGLDVVVNNAGIIRDRMLVSMSEDEWDDVVRVHLKGTFGPSRHAAAYWRERSKQDLPNDARIINITSGSGLFANPGQSNYGAAKAGIAAFTQILAQELGRYGVTANAVAPGGLTRMTEGLSLSPELKERIDPRWVAPVVTWLASIDSADVTGQVLESSGAVLAVAEGWRRGPTSPTIPETAADVGDLVRPLLDAARPRTHISEAM